MATEIDEARFGRDLLVPLDEGEDLRETPTGDVPSAAGYANLRRALVANCLTTPGEVLHRPDYGGGLVEEVEQPGTPGSRARAANRLRRSLRADSRVRDATVSVAPGLPDEDRPGAVTATVTVYPRGDESGLPLTVTAE